MSEIELRPWQREALHKAEKWLIQNGQDPRFLINAAPGSGKTICASVIAKRLFELDKIDRVIVIAPRSEVVRQWADDFKMVTGRRMLKVTSPDDIEDLGLDLCATWQAVQGLMDGFQAVCRSSRTLVICDEHHHAAVAASWGRDANKALVDASYALLLTGTPIRSDGNETVWLAYDDAGRIEHPEDGTYTLTYGEAVDFGYCRPITFHRHEGNFSVDFGDGTSVDVSSQNPAELPDDLKKLPHLQTALDFYKLACTPDYEEDDETPSLDSYHASMLSWGIAKLDSVKNRLPNAGGLIIAPTIELAEYFAKLIHLMEGEKPTLVHSQTNNVEAKIASFRASDKRWMVSVAMISEGVDIKRLRVLVYLPKALTELSFRQAVGRVVRTDGPEDDSRAYVVMPSFETFENYARRVESEMPSGKRKTKPPASKRCPLCSEENELSATRCSYCEYEFPIRRGGTTFTSCPECESLNPRGSKECQSCGAELAQTPSPFILTLREALRSGAIVRGMDLTEDEVREGEKLADDIIEAFYASGDENLIKFLRTFPEESFGRMNKILRDIQDKNSGG